MPLLNHSLSCPPSHAFDACAYGQSPPRILFGALVETPLWWILTALHRWIVSSWKLKVPSVQLRQKVEVSSFSRSGGSAPLDLFFFFVAVRSFLA